MVEAVVGGLLALVSGALGAWLAHRFGRDDRSKAFELNRLSLFADRRIRAYLDFQRACATFRAGRFEPGERRSALQQAYDCMATMWLVTEGPPNNIAIEAYQAMVKEAQALTEYVISTEVDKEGKAPTLLRFERDESEARRFEEQLGDIELRFLNAVRSELGMQGELKHARAFPGGEAANDARDAGVSTNATSARVKSAVSRLDLP